MHRHVRVDFLFGVPFAVVMAKGLQAEVAAGFMESALLKGFASGLDAFLHIQFRRNAEGAKRGVSLGRVLQLLENAFAAHAQPPGSCVMRHPMRAILIAVFGGFV